MDYSVVPQEFRITGGYFDDATGKMVEHHYSFPTTFYSDEDSEVTKWITSDTFISKIAEMEKKYSTHDFSGDETAFGFDLPDIQFKNEMDILKTVAEEWYDFFKQEGKVPSPVSLEVFGDEEVFDNE